MQRLSYCVLILGLSGAAAGCADTGDEGIVIRHNLVPAAGCALNPGGMFTSRGTIELDSPNPYVLTPEIESRITATEGNFSQRTIALRGARVDVEVASITVDNVAAPVPTLTNTSFTSLFSASLEPLGTTAASFDAVSATLLGELASQVTATGNVRIQLVATAKVFGDLGGSEIESVPFIYPITVCTDCVAISLGACPLALGTQLRAGNPCNIFQDGNVDCCLDANMNKVCPGIVATAAQ
ncbi:MAG: hypothetical protein H0X17_09420 [Deltaproteobacteria bacterium]|nr:hypothetical protein [Deltaproteobacteria bacterium]